MISGKLLCCTTVVLCKTEVYAQDGRALWWHTLEARGVRLAAGTGTTVCTGAIHKTRTGFSSINIQAYILIP